MNAVELKNCRIKDNFWSFYKQLVRDAVLPYQWDALNDKVEGAEPSHAVKNMKIAAGLEQGEFAGFVFQDSDIMKWIEAVGYSLTDNPDDEMEQHVDELVEYFAKAQQSDGYLDSYYIINGLEQRFTNLRDCHELYCLGHMIEAAVAYFEATEKRKFLDIACKFADLVDETFGVEEGKLKGYPGHQEVELALVKLHRVTGNERYLRLAEYFINQRGGKPHYFEIEWEKRGRTSHWDIRPSKTFGDMKYHQAHKPVREQTEAVGHAVRAVYMYTGMAAVARNTGDESLIRACEVLWNNIVEKQLYITGGIGQTHFGEAFSFDYHLPNDTVYSETCAAIGLVFFAHEMLQIEPNAKYADVMEQALYNTILAGMARDGKQFFYVNPLETWPEASEKDPGRRHVKAERQAWFGCSCCPPNVARLLASLGKYIYSQNNDDIFAHLFIGSEAEFGSVSVKQETEYPWNGLSQFTFGLKESKEFTFHIRIPSWCNSPVIRVGEERIANSIGANGYLSITRKWSDGDIVLVEFPMKARYVRANKKVRANAGKAAVVRGPIVFCAEEADNGGNIPAIRFVAANELSETFDPAFFGGSIVLHTCGKRDNASEEALYFTLHSEYDETDIKLIPYAFWGNRGLGEMAVWLPVLV